MLFGFDLPQFFQADAVDLRVDAVAQFKTFLQLLAEMAAAAFSKERVLGMQFHAALKGRGGFAVLAELHRTPQWQRIPVVVVTAKELSEADRMQIIRRSDAIVQKGALSKNDLLREIKQLISKNEPKSGVSK